MIPVQIESDGVDLPPISTEWISNICKTIFNDFENSDATITIIFSTDTKLRELKKEYFSQDVLTDTISFNLEEEGDAIEGEIYISLERVADNAKKFNQTFEKECKRVIIHSMLHLLGIEDNSSKDKNKMTQLEDYYLLNTITADQD
tara:strand:- start:72 stop:509 length:438 start_codon:yes stop_codon:yes gene_type:complete